MELEEEEPQICRLCGQCESIYIDVFGEEGTKRFLSLKIHTKINILIEKEDGLPHLICMQCLGTLEFLCDFHERCYRVQQDLLTAKERTKSDTKYQTEIDTDSDKENVLPAKISAKRKTKIVQLEPSKNDTVSKTVNLEESNSSDTKSGCHTSNVDNVQLKTDDDFLTKRENFCMNTLETKENKSESVQSVEVSVEPEESLQGENVEADSSKTVPCTTKSDVTNSPTHSEDVIKDNCKVVGSDIKSSRNKRCTRSCGLQTGVQDTKKDKREKNSRNEMKRAKNSIKKSLARNGNKLKYKQKSERSKGIIEKRTILRSMVGNGGRILYTAVNSNLSGINNNRRTRDNLHSQQTCESTSTPSVGDQISNNAKFDDDKIILDTVEINEINGWSGESSEDIAKSNAVPVIVKQEKFEVDEALPRASQFSKPNQFVWLPNTTILREPEKPKPKKGEKPTNKSPAPGDEAESNQTRGVNSTKSGLAHDNHTDRHSSQIISTQAAQESKRSTEQNRKSVIELTQNVKANRTSKTTSKDNDNSTRVSRITKSSDSHNSETHLSTDNVRNGTDFRTRRETAIGKFGKVSELISDEQKEVIETLYRIDMAVVDNDQVYKNLTFVDKINIQCNICGLVYPRMDKCQVHIWSHLGMKPYCCKACDFTTVTVSNVRCHIRKSHLKIKPFECHLCEKKYVTAVLLEEHLNTHTGAKPYRCKLCDFSSASRQVLSYHKTTHKPIKDINCNICGKEFYSKGRMRAHMIIHNKNKAFMCKFCSTYLCNAEALEKHCKNIHSRDYVCNICGKCTKSKKALHNHQNVHSAAKYKCPICPNIYKSSHILKEHLLKHEGIRKYKCNICQKSFAQQSHLAAHKAVHSEKRYFCPGCNRPFNRHDNMKMHTKRCEIFLANPELSNLLAKRDRSRLSKKVGNSETSSESPSTSRNMPKSENENTLITLKTDVKYSKTDLYLSMPNSTTNTDGKNVLESKDGNSIRIGEVDIFPMVESNVTNTVEMNVNVTVVENVLGPECF